MSSIRKLKNGRYQTQVYDRYGKRHRRTFDKKMQAEEFVRKIESVKANDKLVSAKLIRQRVSIEKAVKDFWSTKSNLAPKTVEKYENNLEQIKAFCEANKVEYVDQFTRHHADQFKDLLVDSGAKSKTVNAYILNLKAVFREQLNRDQLTRNPTSHLKCLPKPVKTLLQREKEYYNEDEVVAFFRQEMHPRYRLAFMGLFLTGMRFEELASLTWNFVDPQKKMIQIRARDGFRPKTFNSERDIPISDRLMKELKIAGTKDENTYVFLSKRGRKLRERRFLEICKDIADKARINKNATLHMWRHTFSSLLSQKGVSLEVRQYLLGHKGNHMTLHYTKPDPSKWHSTVSMLDVLLEVPDDDG